MKYIVQVDGSDVAVHESLGDAQTECETYLARQQEVKVVAMADVGEIAEIAWWYYDLPNRCWVRGSGGA